MVATATPPKQELQTVPFAVPSVTFELSLAQIDELRAEYMALVITDVNDKKQIAAVNEARGLCKKLRVGTEKIGKAARDGFNKAAKDVIAQERLLTDPISKIEEHLEAELAKVKAEHDRIAKEAEEARQAMIRERGNAILAYAFPGCDYIPLDQIAAMSQEDFDKLLVQRQREKKAYDEQAAAEKAEADRVAQENRAKAEQLAEAETRLKRMSARITMLAREGYEHPYSDDQLADKSPDDWEALIDEARSKRAERDKAAADEKAALDKQREDLAEQQAKIDAENQRIADEAEAKRNAELQSRVIAFVEADTFTLAPTIAEVAAMSDEQFERAIVDAKLRKQKRDDERDAAQAEETRIAAEAEAAKLAAIEAALSDREKFLAIADKIERIKLPPVSVYAAKAAARIEEIIAECAVDIREEAGRLVGADG